MPAATRKGDIGSGHDACPPTPAITGSPDVYVDGKPVVRVGDAYKPHKCKKHAKHPRAQASGSGTVFVNGKPVARIGDGINCGGAAAAGSPTVFVDDNG